MTSEAASIAATLPTRPYARSWPNVLVDAIDRSRVPRWLVLGAIAVAGVIAIHTQPWSLGTSPVGTFDGPNTFWGLVPAVIVFLMGYLIGEAERAFESFRPALTVGDEAQSRLRYELVVLPAWPSAAITVLAAAFLASSYAIDPIGAGVAGLPTPILLARFAIEGFNVAALFLLIYQLLRQMRLVRETLARSTVVNFLRPGPLHAFSRLMSRAGISILVLVAGSILAGPFPPDMTVESFLRNWAPYVILPPIVATIAFIVPLHGTHNRLVAEKERLQGEADERLAAVLAEIHRDVDARQLTRASGLNTTLASLVQEREILSKLPTWPWSTGTLRAFVTAILLPLFVFVAQRVLSQVL